MRIVYVLARGDEIGGAHIHVGDLAAECIRRGHETLILFGEGEVYSNYLNERELPFIQLKKLGRSVYIFRDLLSILELNKVFRRFNPDIISLHSAKAGVIGRLSASILKCPVLFTAHGWSSTDGVSKYKAFIYKNIEKILSKFCERIITVSDYDRTLALRSNVGNEQTIIRVWNGRPGINSSLIASPSKGSPRLVMVARFEKQKDHNILISSLSNLKNKCWELALIGDGPLKADIEQAVRKENFKQRIQFLGRIGSVSEELSKSNIYVLSTKWEGLPRSIIEAMRAGLPVVATNVGGIAELIEHEKNGFLVPRGDINSLTKALKILIEDSSRREKMGDFSRILYLEKFSQERWLAETFNVYSQIIGKSL